MQQIDYDIYNKKGSQTRATMNEAFSLKNMIAKFITESKSNELQSSLQSQFPHSERSLKWESLSVKRVLLEQLKKALENKFDALEAETRAPLDARSTLFKGFGRTFGSLMCYFMVRMMLIEMEQGPVQEIDVIEQRMDELIEEMQGYRAFRLVLPFCKICYYYNLGKMGRVEELFVTYLESGLKSDDKVSIECAVRTLGYGSGSLAINFSAAYRNIIEHIYRMFYHNGDIEKSVEYYVKFDRYDYRGGDSEETIPLVYRALVLSDYGRSEESICCFQQAIDELRGLNMVGKCSHFVLDYYDELALVGRTEEILPLQEELVTIVYKDQTMDEQMDILLVRICNDYILKRENMGTLFGRYPYLRKVMRESIYLSKLEKLSNVSSGLPGRLNRLWRFRFQLPMDRTSASILFTEPLEQRGDFLMMSDVFVNYLGFQWTINAPIKGRFRLKHTTDVIEALMESNDNDQFKLYKWSGLPSIYLLPSLSMIIDGPSYVKVVDLVQLLNLIFESDFSDFRFRELLEGISYVNGFFIIASSRFAIEVVLSVHELLNLDDEMTNYKNSVIDMVRYTTHSIRKFVICSKLNHSVAIVHRITDPASWTIYRPDKYYEYDDFYVERANNVVARGILNTHFVVGIELTEMHETHEIHAKLLIIDTYSGDVISDCSIDSVSSESNRAQEFRSFYQNIADLESLIICDVPSGAAQYQYYSLFVKLFEKPTRVLTICIDDNSVHLSIRTSLDNHLRLIDRGQNHNLIFARDGECIFIHFSSSVPHVAAENKADVDLFTRIQLVSTSSVVSYATSSNYLAIHSMDGTLQLFGLNPVCFLGCTDDQFETYLNLIRIDEKKGLIFTRTELGTVCTFDLFTT